MPRRPTVLFVANVPWRFVWQRHQTLASLFARDAEVLYCEIPGVRRVGVADLPRILARVRELGWRNREADRLPEHLRVLRPFVLPAVDRLSCALNAWFVGRLVRREPALARGVDLIVDYPATRTALQLIARVPHARLLYDCTDNWVAVPNVPEFLAADERELLRRADLTLVPSRFLENEKRPVARRLVRVPHGALVERFLSAPRVRGPAEPVTLLYYGHLHGQHFDFAAIDALARQRPEWRVELIGPVRTRHRFADNVRLVGQQPHEQLGGFIAKADVLLLPYRLNAYTRAVLPAKVYECLATGRPIVAAPLPELTADFAPYLHFAHQPGDWTQAVETALAEPPARAAERIAHARANSWQARYAQIRDLVGPLDGRVDG